jgi:hypothetical protein
MTVLIADVVWMVFLALPSPVSRVDPSIDRWLLAAIIATVFLILRIVLTESVLDGFARAVGDDSVIRHRMSGAQAADPLLADQYLSLVLESDLVQTLIPATTALVSPATYTDRITENRTLGEERSSVSITRTVSGAATLTAIPVLRVEKGTLVGSLSVTVDGKAGRTLTFDQARGLLIAVIYTLHDRVFKPSAKFLDAAVTAILQQKPISDEGLAALLAHIERHEADHGESAASRALRAITYLATTCDYVFAVVDEGCEKATKVTISYEEPYRIPINSFSSIVRRTFGLGRRDYVSDLHTASEARSYHLDVTGPDGMYVDNPYVVMPFRSSAAHEAPISTRTTRERDELVLIAPSRGDAKTHLYVRDLDGSPLIASADPARYLRTKPQFVIEFREKPPGFLGPTATLSLWVATVTWVVGFNYMAVFPTVATPGSAWPAVIFGVPALVTGLLLSKLSTETLRVISVYTFFCVAWLAIDAAAVVTLAALKTTGISLGPVTLGIVHLEHRSWAAMMVLTALNLLACCWIFISASTRYASVINERATE